MSIDTILRSFMPHSAPITLAEKLRSGLAGGIAILLLALSLRYLPQHDYPLMLLTPMAASAALLYAAPHSPFSQPWNLVGGHVVSAVCGWICSVFIPADWLAGGLAVGSAITLTYILKCLHPPGAATALLMVLSSSQFHDMGWQWTAWIVFANAGISVLLALLINNAVHGRHYPMPLAVPGHPKIETVVAPEQADIEWAVEQMDSMIDVSLEDLTEIYGLALDRARARHGNAGR